MLILEIAAGNQTNIIVTLSSTAATLNEVVVTCAGRKTGKA
jgi:hypothetical protein